MATPTSRLLTQQNAKRQTAELDHLKHTWLVRPLISDLKVKEKHVQPLFLVKAREQSQ